MPIVLKGVEDPPESSLETHIRKARIAAARTAIGRLEELEHEYSQANNGSEHATIIARLKGYYRRRVAGLDGHGPDQASANLHRRLERELRLEALHAERHAINRLVEERSLEQEAAREILHKLDNLEATLQPM